MFYPLKIDDSHQDGVLDFEAALQEELIEKGERVGTWRPGRSRLPVAEAEHLADIGIYYIRVYQHRLTQEDFEQLVGDLCEKIWGRRDVVHIDSIVRNDPNH